MLDKVHLDQYAHQLYADHVISVLEAGEDLL